MRVANFWEQQGIYLLYDDYGPYYVGQTRGEHINLGKRLRQHAMGLNGSPHKNKWDRFSWFGWRGVLDGTDRRGLRTLRKMPQRLLTDSSKSVNDIESLLIHCRAAVDAGGTGLPVGLSFEGPAVGEPLSVHTTPLPEVVHRAPWHCRWPLIE